jgi:hypothetical protein
LLCFAAVFANQTWAALKIRDFDGRAVMSMVHIPDNRSQYLRNTQTRHDGLDAKAGFLALSPLYCCGTETIDQQPVGVHIVRACCFDPKT